VKAFATAARNAMAAGSDGVKIHAAKGCLLDQSGRDGSNRRLGSYGGSIANRARLLLEVVTAETPLTGVRLSPLNSFNDMADRDPVALGSWLAEQLNHRCLAYRHQMRADLLGRQQGDVLTQFRQLYSGVLIANMGYGVEAASGAAASGAVASGAVASRAVDALLFGHALLANPDQPHRRRTWTPAAAGTPTPPTALLMDSRSCHGPAVTWGLSRPAG